MQPDSLHSTSSGPLLSPDLSPAPRLVYALHFEITPSEGSHSTSLIVWPDNPTRIARPVNREKRWLEVEAGDEVFLQGKRREVLEVRVYRSSRGHEGGPVVRSDREWMGKDDA